MSRPVLLAVIFSASLHAQAVPHALAGARLEGVRWVADALPAPAFVPPIDGSAGELTVWAPPGEIRSSMLAVGVGTGFVFRARIRAAGGGGLRIAFGADPSRTRGYELDVRGPGRKAALHRLTIRGPEEVSSVSWPSRAGAVEEHGVEVRLSGGSLSLEVDGRVRAPRGGWRLGAVETGRFHLGAADGAVRMESVAFSLTLGGRSLRRLRALEARGTLAPLPDPRDVPLQGPLDSIEAEDLTDGLTETEAAEVLRARSLATRGRLEAAFGILRPLRTAKPEAPGPAFVEAAMRLLELADAPGAIAALRLARGLPGAEALLGDALWMVGDLQAAQAAYARAKDAGGQALVRWARGRRDDARRLAEQGRSRGCRRAGQRLRLVDDLAMLLQWPSFHGTARDRVRVISDLSSTRAERALRMTLPFLNAAEAWLPGESAPAPLTVFVCASRDVFAQWNDRLGGARFEEADGIYRPGTGLLVVLDDDDDEVLRRRLQHECVHHVVWERGWAMPRPMEEGLCELLAHGRAVGRSIVKLDALAPGRYPLARRLATGGRFERPAEVLLRRDLRDGDPGREDYAQAWASLWALISQRDGTKALAELVTLSGDLQRRAELKARITATVPRSSVVKRLTSSR